MSQRTQDITLLTYPELLEQLGSNSPNHLLLGNGFNNSLGIRTSYAEIFSRMKKCYSGYKNVEGFFADDSSVDIEKLIGHLKEQVEPDKEDFLKKYIERKVKLDFMRAANEIVQENINKVYQDKSQGIHLLLKNFTNYFTLNYDPCLYLLLLKFKKDESDLGNALAMQNDSLFQQEDLNQRQNNICGEIRQLRKEGTWRINIGPSSGSKSDLSKTKKGRFEVVAKEYNDKQEKGWMSEDISKVCNLIWKEESNIPELSVRDGFQSSVFKEDNLQNLFFLHGSFYIVKGKRACQKITAKQNKSFCEKLEEAIHSEDKDIVCVLTSQTEEKQAQIDANVYLKKCLDDLSKISGNLVVFGCALKENDQHIFDQVNKSNISRVYVSSRKEKKDRDFDRARSIFNEEKQVILFDYETVSYSKVGHD